MSLLRSSAVTGGLTMVSRFFGLARDLVLTAVMGAGGAADAFNTALQFPNLWRRIFAEGAFATAFVPLYARELTGSGAAEADRQASEAMAALTFGTILLTVAAQLAMPWLMALISPGFVADPEKFKLAVTLTQITMPYLPAMAIAALFSGVLNARGRFIAAAGVQSLLNLVILAFVWPQTTAQNAAFYGSCGVTIAGAMQVGVLWWAAGRAGARVRLQIPRLTPAVRRILLLAAPGALAASATQVNILVSSWFASFVDGARTWLATADRLYQLPLGIVGVGIGVALLPRLSMSLKTRDSDRARNQMDEALTFAMALTLPASMALIAMPFLLIDGFFARGLFSHQDAARTAQALFHYGWGVPAFVLIKLYTPLFFAMEDTRTPMRYALVSVAVNIVLGATLFQIIGFQGIAAGTSAAAWVNFALLMRGVQRRELYRPSWEAVNQLLRIAAASLVLAVVLGFAELEYAAMTSILFGSRLLAVLATSVTAAGLYIMLVFSLGGMDYGQLRKAFSRAPKGTLEGPADHR